MVPNGANRTSRHNTIRPIGMQQTPRTQFPAEGPVAPVAAALGAPVTCLAGSRQMWPWKDVDANVGYFTTEAARFQPDLRMSLLKSTRSGNTPP